ncbi:MAG: hypothetical protein ACETVO_01735 [bacterium]
MDILVNLEKLNSHVKKVLVPFSQAMIALQGDNLKSISLYGSAVGEDFIPKRSNINLLLVMGRIDPPDLKMSLKLINQARKKGIVPLLLTVQHVKSSTDTFPVEFLEMKENYILIYGKDILGELEVDSRNIRHQCEQQLKGGLIRLYQVYLEIGMRKKRIRSLLINSLTSFIPVFRSLLRLKGKVLPVKKRDVISDLEREFAVNSGIFLKVLQMKEGRKVEDNLEKLFGDYLEEVEKLCIICDRMEV